MTDVMINGDGTWHSIDGGIIWVLVEMSDAYIANNRRLTDEAPPVLEDSPPEE